MCASSLIIHCASDDDETGRISFKNLKRVAKELGETMTEVNAEGDSRWGTCGGLVAYPRCVIKSCTPHVDIHV